MVDQKFQFVGPNNSLINIIAQDRDALIEFLKKNPYPEKNRVLRVERADCGCHIEYPTFESIHDDDVICEHGHYFILYVNKQTKEVQEMIMNAGKSVQP